MKTDCGNAQNKDNWTGAYYAPSLVSPLSPRVYFLIEGVVLWFWKFSLLIHKNIRITINNKKSETQCSNLWVWFLRGWRRCLKVTLQTCAPSNFHSCWRGWGVSDTVKRTQMGSKDPNRREQMILLLIILAFSYVWYYNFEWYFCSRRSVLYTTFSELFDGGNVFNYKILRIMLLYCKDNKKRKQQDGIP